MQTALDPTLSHTLEQARQPGLTLVISNKNYSSWSMRPWVAAVAFGIPFTEVRVLLDQPDTATNIMAYSAAGRVPVLLAGDMTVWDSLAIVEYLAEQFPDKAMWPQDVAARAMARSVVAEMHSGFAGLRSAMSMNIRARIAPRPDFVSTMRASKSPESSRATPTAIAWKSGEAPALASNWSAAHL